MTISEKLKVLIEEQKNQSFINPETATDSDALGIIISQYFEWDSKGIFESSYSAFEDSNFHKFNKRYKKIWDQQYKKWKGGN